MINNSIIIEDTTLREGEQTPGVALSLDDKLSIIKVLDSINVPMIEVGIASMGGHEKTFIEKAIALNTKATLIGWNRAKLDDLKCSIDCGLKAVHIGVPVSDIHLKASLKKERIRLYNEVQSLIRYSKESGLFVSVSAEDASRTKKSDILEYAGYVKEAGADRLRLSDTLGLFNPLDFYDLVKDVVEEKGIDVQIHAHNDLGLAMANVLAGVQAGAKYVQATINGWGERVGLVALEVVVVALKRILGIETGINHNKFPEVCSLVASLFNRSIPPWQPIVGNDIFIQESGIHVSASINDSSAFEPFPPEWVGKQHVFVAGKHSGSKGIQFILENEGISVSREESSGILPSIREKAIERKTYLTIEELIKIYNKSKT
jgi:homocitrate synthase NifV